MVGCTRVGSAVLPPGNLLVRKKGGGGNQKLQLLAVLCLVDDRLGPLLPLPEQQSHVDAAVLVALLELVARGEVGLVVQVGLEQHQPVAAAEGGRVSESERASERESE